MLRLTNKEVRIETTNYCNCSCIMCPREEMTRPKVTMSYDHFCRLVCQACDLGAELISPFGFGEPLLDPTIVEKVDYCTERGLRTFITTNASLLGPDMGQGLLDAGLSHIRFSAHGTYRNYEKVHRGLDFSLFMRNVFNFVKVRRQAVCKVSVTVIPLHGETVDDILAFWGDKVDDIEIWKPHQWCDKSDCRQETKGERKLNSCGRLNRGPVQIQSDGRVIPCCFLTNAELVLGDTHNNSIEEILKDEPYRMLREKHKSGNLTGLPCADCDQLFVEKVSPLLYSTIDPSCEVGKTSSMKFTLLKRKERKVDGKRVE